jgi:hypothetical protein
MTKSPLVVRRYPTDVQGRGTPRPSYPDLALGTAPSSHRAPADLRERYDGGNLHGFSKNEQVLHEMQLNQFLMRTLKGVQIQI